jgi:hypothetical protein
MENNIDKQLEEKRQTLIIELVKLFNNFQKDTGLAISSVYVRNLNMRDATVGNIPKNNYVISEIDISLENL